ncbi:tcdB toxin N-terminal helical domain protein, partial [Chlamydia psittaci 08DC60]
MKIGA